MGRNNLTRKDFGLIRVGVIGAFMERKTGLKHWLKKKPAHNEPAQEFNLVRFGLKIQGLKIVKNY